MHRIKIVLAFLLLAALIFTPTFYAERQNARLMRGITITPASALTLDVKSVSASSSLWERLELMRSAEQVTTEPYPNVVFVKSYVGKNELNSFISDIINTMEAELTELSALGALPSLPFSEKATISVTKETYLKPPSPLSPYGMSSSVFAICADYSDIHVHVYMDAEEYLILSIDIIRKNGAFLYDAPRDGDSFLKYLSARCPVPDSGVEYFARAVCSSNNASLKLFSLNDDGKIFEYSFGNPDYKGIQDTRQYIAVQRDSAANPK